MKCILCNQVLINKEKDGWYVAACGCGLIGCSREGERAATTHHLSSQQNILLGDDTAPFSEAVKKSGAALLIAERNLKKRISQPGNASLVAKKLLSLYQWYEENRPREVDSFPCMSTEVGEFPSPSTLALRERAKREGIIIDS